MNRGLISENGQDCSLIIFDPVATHRLTARLSAEVLLIRRVLPVEMQPSRETRISSISVSRPLNKDCGSAPQTSAFHTASVAFFEVIGSLRVLVISVRRVAFETETCLKWFGLIRKQDFGKLPANCCRKCV